MRTIKFEVTQEIPIIDAKVFGPLGSRNVRLVFDTGAGFTQIDTSLMEELGYSASASNEIIRVQGPAGDFQDGHIVSLQNLKVFGKQFKDIAIGVYDFDNFDQYGIDGLLGFDVIKQLHLEMNGPDGILKIF